MLLNRIRASLVSGGDNGLAACTCHVDLGVGLCLRAQARSPSRPRVHFSPKTVVARGCPLRALNAFVAGLYLMAERRARAVRARSLV